MLSVFVNVRLQKQCVFTASLSHADALFEKKQTIMIYESETAQFQAQVEELEAKSAEKDTLVAKYKAVVKESKGQTSS